jgi:hypothetical protein
MHDCCMTGAQVAAQLISSLGTSCMLSLVVPSQGTAPKYAKATSSADFQQQHVVRRPVRMLDAQVVPELVP